MISHTLHLDCEVSNEELLRFENCAGVIGLSAYQNVINLYYVQPLARREKHSVLEAIQDCYEEGIEVLWITSGEDALQGIATYL